MSTADLITFGEPLLEFARLDDPDRSLFLQGYGGDTSNVAVAAARQEASVAVLARLGRDGPGDAFERLWRDEGIDTSLVQRDDEAPTGVYFIDYDERGHHFTYLRKGSAATRLGPERLPLEALAAARAVHVSGITQAISTESCDAVFAALKHARGHDTAVSYDFNLRTQLWPLERARAIMAATVPHVDHCLPSLDDARTLLGLEAPEAIVEHLEALGAATIVLKLGADGSLVSARGRRERVPAHPVDAVDATAAGDTFDGAYLAEVLRGADPVEAARHAGVAAALSTRGHGAVAPMPTRERTLAEGASRA